MASNSSRRVTDGVSRLVLALVLAAAAVCVMPAGEARGDDPNALPLGSEDALKFAYDWAQYGKNPDTNKVIDTTIAVMTIASPPVGAVLGVAKGLVTAVTGGPDPVGQAIAQINHELVALNSRMDDLQKQLDALQDFSFREANYARLRELKRRKEEIEQIRDDLRARPTDPAAKAKLVRDALRVADRFLDQGADEADLWDWSDRLHVYSDPANPGKLTGALLPPRFKPLPTFEYYMSSLALAMVAIEYEAGGNYATVKQTYGPRLLRHASFLSVRPYWRELDEPTAPDHLPERLMAAITCGSQPVTTYPVNGDCTFRDYCSDTFAQTLDETVGSGTYTLRASNPNTLCTLPISTPRGVPTSERDAARQPANLVYGSDAMATIEDRATRRIAQEAELEGNWGVDAMTYLADELTRLAANGTLREQFIGRFDATTWKKEFLYAVEPNGDLVWYAHLFGVDHNPPGSEPPKISAERAGSGFQAPRRADPRSRAGAVATQPSAGKFAGPSAGRLGKSVLPSVVSGAPPPAAPPAALPVIHEWQGPKLVGTGWQSFREVIPAWYGPIDGSGSAYGFSLYALRPDGHLAWYRHDGFADGTSAWRGPVDVGGGWGGFAHIVAMSDGVVYGIGQDGSLRWFKQSDAGNAAASPTWSGPILVGTGWGGFSQVFGGGQGVIYAENPDGTLLWYRHTGYLTGANTWEGPKVVGSGWQIFTHLFSPGEGIIYGLKPTGELFWYRHDGYSDGTVRWQPPAQVASEWNVFSEVFPLMWGSPAAPLVR